jgi:endoglycosylceramidase
MKKVIYIFASFLFLISCKKETSTQEKLPNVLFAKRGTQPGIFDAQGRFVILRGANYNVLGDYWQANPAIATVKDYNENDFKMMASYGLNCVRLVFNWSALEPVRGQYNQAYIDRIKKAIEDAAKYNIYILIDMHQDAWSKYIVSSAEDNCNRPTKGWDGAPEWATITDGESTCMSEAGIGSGRETVRAVVHAFQNFWDNTDGINDACIDAWIHLLKQTANYKNVLGYDLFNEPSLGYKALDEEVVKIGNYYSKLIKAIRNAEEKYNLLSHIVFFETSISWNGNPIPFVPNYNFTNEPNICFAPHHYFESITDLLTIELGYSLLKSLAKMYNTGMLIGEYGFFDSDTSISSAKLKRFARVEDENFYSSTIWSWSQAPGDPHTIDWSGNNYPATDFLLSEIDINGNFTGNLKTSFLNVLSRTRPNAIVGYPSKLMSNPDNGNMYLEATTDKSGITEIWIPNRFGTPKISGSNATLQSLTIVEGGFIAKVEVQKNYSIEVSF